jgi:hypothetical protein
MESKLFPHNGNYYSILLPELRADSGFLLPLSLLKTKMLWN